MAQMTLKAARTNVGLTQKAAAKELEVSNKTLGEWEKGRSFPNADKIKRILDVYKCSYDDIIFLPDNSL